MRKKLTKWTFISILVLTALIAVSCSSSEDKTEKTEKTKKIQLWTCGMHPEVILEEPGQCPKCGMNLVPLKQSGLEQVNEEKTSEKPAGKGKILYWQAPMNPTEIYDAPGKSKMGMDLVPVYEGQVSSGSTVKIDPVTVQNMGVRTATVKRIDFSRTVRAVGTIDYNEEKIYVVSARISGWIDKLYVDYTGKPVRKGQRLLEIYSPELVTTQQEYLLALNNQKLIAGTEFAGIRDGAASLVRSSRERLLYWNIPESQIKRLEETGKVRKNITLDSPASGIITEKKVIEGQHVKAGMTLYQISDLSTVWVYASVYDSELPWIKKGQEAEIELSYLPGEKLKGQIDYIYPYLNEKTRDVKVRIAFANPQLKLKPGMYGNVIIKSTPIPNAIVIPSEAVIRSGKRTIVFIARGEGRFEPREVTIGEEGDNGNIRIINGLLADEKVVISAQFLIDSESRLQEAIQKMIAEKAQAAANGNDKSSVEKSGQEKPAAMDMDNMEEENQQNETEQNHEMETDHKDMKKATKKSDDAMKCDAGKCGSN